MKENNEEIKDKYKASILIVDDEPQALEEISELLEGNNHKIFLASCGKDALEIAQKTSLNLALLDLKLPDIDGIELSRRIKEIQPGILEIIITAYGSLENALKAIHEEMYDYMLKPFDPKGFVQTVKRALEKEKALREGKELLARMQTTIKTVSESKEMADFNVKKLYNFLMQREQRITELQKEVNSLLRESGKPPKYVQID